MNYKTIRLMSASLIALLIMISGMRMIRKRQASVKEGVVIGILQTASHPALDAAREGLIEVLTSKLGDTVHFILQNAQGSMSHAHAIAQRFHVNNDVKAIYAIATPVAQALAAIEKEKPIIIAAVTDPTILGAQENITGVSDMVDIQKAIDMMYQLLPQAKTIAVIYSNAEANSLVQVQRIKQELEKRGKEALEVGITHESDIPTALSLACRKADAVICPTDNMLASCMELVASIALRSKKPLIAFHNQAVEQGALAARGVDYRECGKQAGDIVYSILVAGKKAHDIPVACPKTDTVYINKQTLDMLGLVIPEILKEQSVLLSKGINHD